MSAALRASLAVSLLEDANDHSRGRLSEFREDEQRLAATLGQSVL